jgi:hypothetical protein
LFAFFYRPRNARDTPLYHLVEKHFDELERVWEERYEREHGFWRPVCRQVVEQFLDRGDPRCGFARLWCATCRKDLLLPYSCRRRCFCPSCHQKRALPYAEYVDQEVLVDLPVRQYIVTIRKMLRLCFKYDRKLLGLLSQCFYASVKELFQDAAQDRRTRPVIRPAAFCPAKAAKPGKLTAKRGAKKSKNSRCIFQVPRAKSPPVRLDSQKEPITKKNNGRKGIFV